MSAAHLAWCRWSLAAVAAGCELQRRAAGRPRPESSITGFASDTGSGPAGGARPECARYRGRVNAWAVRGVELPFGDEPRSWWIEASGLVHDRPVARSECLPGGFLLSGLGDAHAPPAVGAGAGGPAC